ncbi:MAG: hypothetical protein HY681_14405 [Chloroflexi bacterium]|nr:hypothetical protein [Chloroflexota bacterium]
MGSLADSATQFGEAIAPFVGVWRSLDLRALADSKQQLLLSLIGCLVPEEPRPIETTDKIREIVFLRGAIPIEDANGFLAELKNGTLNLGSYRLSTQEFQNGDFHALDRQYNDDFVAVWSDYASSGHFWLNSWASRNLESLVDSGDLWAAARLQGFESFPELAKARLQFGVGAGKALRLSLFAPVLIELAGQGQTDGAVAYSIRFPRQLRAADFKLSYRRQDDRANRVDGGPLQLALLQRSDQDQSTVLSGSLPVSSNVARAELTLFHSGYRSGNEPIAVKHIDIPRATAATARGNPRWEATKSIVSSTPKWLGRGQKTAEQALKDWIGISGAEPDDKEFERGVGCLLFLAGLSAVHIGDADGVDFLVLDDPAKIVVLVSCTVSTQSVATKLASLKPRVNRLAEILGQYTVRGAVFVPHRRQDMTVGTIESADDEEGMYLVLQDQLKEFHEQATGRDYGNAGRHLIATLITPKMPRRRGAFY